MVNSCVHIYIPNMHANMVTVMLASRSEHSTAVQKQSLYPNENYHLRLAGAMRGLFRKSSPY